MGRIVGLIPEPKIEVKEQGKKHEQKKKKKPAKSEK